MPISEELGRDNFQSLTNLCIQNYENQKKIVENSYKYLLDCIKIHKI